MTPRVSVIVPNYNHSQYLIQRIDSILLQTYQDFELILLDDFSKDRSCDILLQYKNNPRVSHIIFNTENSGSPFKQWNKGISLARGEYVWIAESDDWAEPVFLECLVAELIQHPNVGLAYAKASYQLNGNEAWESNASNSIKTYQGNSFICQKLLYTNVIYNVSMTVFKRSVFLEIQHELYENMILCGDWFMYVLLCQKSDVLEYDKILSNYRMHETNTSSRAEREGKSFLEGVIILDYIIKYEKINKTLRINFFWARQWVKYYVKFNFNSKTNNLIISAFFKRHKLIVLLFIVYKYYYLVKTKSSLL